MSPPEEKLRLHLPIWGQESIMSLTEVIIKGKYGYAHANTRRKRVNKFEDERRTDSGW